MGSLATRPHGLAILGLMARHFVRLRRLWIRASPQEKQNTYNNKREKSHEKP